MKIINKLLSKYTEFRKKMKAWGDAAEIREEEKKKNYYLTNYGAYKNADMLTHQEMLEVFWKILREDSYDTSKFNSNTSVREPAKQLSDWDDLGGDGFITTIYRMFNFSSYEFTDNEYEQIATFGELADLIIKKAKEKKLQKQE